MAVLAMMADTQTIKALPINMPWGKRMANKVCVTTSNGDAGLHCQVLIGGNLYAFHPLKPVEVPYELATAVKGLVGHFPELGIEEVSQFDPRLNVDGAPARVNHAAPISYIPSKATLDKLSKTELAEFAQAAGIDVPEDVSKRDLVAALDAAR